MGAVGGTEGGKRVGEKGVVGGGGKENVGDEGGGSSWSMGVTRSDGLERSKEELGRGVGKGVWGGGVVW